jgi:hypothetical protein
MQQPLTDRHERELQRRHESPAAGPGGPLVYVPPVLRAALRRFGRGSEAGPGHPKVAEGRRVPGTPPG